MVNRSKQANGLSLGKIAVIGVLSVVLLLVIVVQFGGQSPAGMSQAVRRRTVAARSESVSAAAPPALTPISKRTEKPWPSFKVAEVVASNPFRLPEVLRPSGEAAQTLPPSTTLGETESTVLTIEAAGVREMRRRQVEFMAGLRAQGVDMILRSPRGSVARVGDLSLQVGDIHEGLRVEEIGPNGVLFAPATFAEGQSE